MPRHVRLIDWSLASSLTRSCSEEYSYETTKTPDYPIKRAIVHSSVRTYATYLSSLMFCGGASSTNQQQINISLQHFTTNYDTTTLESQHSMFPRQTVLAAVAASATLMGGMVEAFAPPSNVARFIVVSSLFSTGVSTKTDACRVMVASVVSRNCCGWPVGGKQNTARFRKMHGSGI